MKKTLKTISALALALLLLLGMGATAFAESKVTYEGGAEKFVFNFLLHSPRNVAAADPLDGEMFNSAYRCPDLAAAYRIAVAGFPVAIHLC